MTITTMTMMATCFFRQQPTLVGCIPGREVVGDFYDDDENEDDGNGDDNEEDHFPCLFQKVLPMQSTASPTVRTTTTTSFYDMTQQPTSWSDAFLAGGGYDNDNDDKDQDNNDDDNHNVDNIIIIVLTLM